MDVKVHVEGIKGSGAIKEGEKPSVLFGGVLEVEGKLIEEVSQIEVRIGEGFVTVLPHLLPGTFEIVTHTGESWRSMLDGLAEAQKARAATGRLIGVHKE